MDFTKCIFRYCRSERAIEFAKTHSLIVLKAQLLRYCTTKCWENGITLIICSSFLWSTARGYNQYNETLNIWNETSASKILVMNQGLEVVSCYANSRAKSLEMDHYNAIIVICVRAYIILLWKMQHIRILQNLYLI